MGNPKKEEPKKEDPKKEERKFFHISKRFKLIPIGSTTYVQVPDEFMKPNNLTGKNFVFVTANEKRMIVMPLTKELDEKLRKEEDAKTRGV